MGDQIDGPVMTVSNFSSPSTRSLAVNDAKLVTVGAPAAIEEPELAITTDGR